jgi:hypothetical protein
LSHNFAVSSPDSCERGARGYTDRESTTRCSGFRGWNQVSFQRKKSHRKADKQTKEKTRRTKLCEEQQEEKVAAKKMFHVTTADEVFESTCNKRNQFKASKVRTDAERSPVPDLVQRVHEAR